MASAVPIEPREMRASAPEVKVLGVKAFVKPALCIL